MGTYQLKREQVVPITLDEAWAFFSSPENLKTITPDYMGFDILTKSSDQMYEGMIISYQVSPVMGIPLTWVSEISHVKAPYFFIDQQVSGPYKYWHHQHKFSEVEGGVLVEDEVNYALPMSFLGAFAHNLLSKNNCRVYLNTETKR